MRYFLGNKELIQVISISYYVFSLLSIITKIVMNIMIIWLIFFQSSSNKVHIYQTNNFLRVWLLIKFISSIILITIHDSAIYHFIYFLNYLIELIHIQFIVNITECRRTNVNVFINQKMKSIVLITVMRGIFKLWRCTMIQFRLKINHKINYRTVLVTHMCNEWRSYFYGFVQYLQNCARIVFPLLVFIVWEFLIIIVLCDCRINQLYAACLRMARGSEFQAKYDQGNYR